MFELIVKDKKGWFVISNVRLGGGSIGQTESFGRTRTIPIQYVGNRKTTGPK